MSEVVLDGVRGYFMTDELKSRVMDTLQSVSDAVAAAHPAVQGERVYTWEEFWGQFWDELGQMRQEIMQN